MSLYTSYVVFGLVHTTYYIHLSILRGKKGFKYSSLYIALNYMCGHVFKKNSTAYKQTTKPNRKVKKKKTRIIGVEKVYSGGTQRIEPVNKLLHT